MGLALYILLPCTYGAEFTQSIQSKFPSSIDPPIISTIYRDSHRLLWIGTQEGLYRFDGVELSRYGPNRLSDTLLPHSYIKGICEDKDGNLFIGTLGGGIYLYNRDASQLEQLELPLVPDFRNIDFMARTQDSIVWASSRETLLAIDSDSKKVIANLKLKKGEFDLGRLKGIIRKDSGEYLLGTSTGLWTVSIQEENGAFILSEFSERGIQALVEASGTIYVVFNNGEVGKITQANALGTENIAFLPSEFSSISYVSVFQESLWIATEQGLISLDLSEPKIQVTNTNNSGLSANYITYLHQDEDILWIGTFLGLNTLKQNHLELYNEKNSGVHYEVLAFSEDSNGALWVGTYDGLYKKESSNSLHRELMLPDGESLKDKRIMTLAGREDELWIGFRSSGVQVLDTSTNSLSSLPDTDISDAEVTKILISEDDIVWIATYNQGLYFSKDGDISKVDSISTQSITMLIETSAGDLLAASEQAVYIKRKESSSFREIQLNFPSPASTPLLLSLTESSSGVLYLGTKDDGIYISSDSLIESDKIDLQRFGATTETSSTTIYGMLIDEEEKLWASTQQGIIVLNPNGKLRFRLRKQDGLQDNDFNFGAVYQDAEGFMYYGGVRGYNKLDPINLIIDYSPPKLHLVSLEVPEEKYYIAGKKGLDFLELGHNDYFITFSFSTLDFASTGASQYRYKLEGFDRQWIDNGNRKTATYTNLPEGSYTFRVEGANSAGVWSTEGISLKVDVLPPPWRTYWAYCIYAIALVLILWAFKRAYDNHNIKVHALKYAAEMVATADRAEDDLQEQQEVQDELIRASYKHHLSLLELIREDSRRVGIEGEIIGRHVEVLALLEECYSYQTDSLQADMHRFTEALVSRLLGDANVPAETIVTINSVTTGLIPAEVASPLSLVMFELLENSLQHAFTETGSVANFIEITLEVSDPIGQESARYSLSVEDNGAGFNASALATPDKATGLGFVRHIADRYEGSLSVSYETGTRVTFEVGNCSTG